MTGGKNSDKENPLCDTEPPARSTTDGGRTAVPLSQCRPRSLAGGWVS